MFNRRRVLALVILTVIPLVSQGQERYDLVLRNGLIVEAWVVGDTQELWRGLGVSP